jgi:hypothetical protein
VCDDIREWKEMRMEIPDKWPSTYKTTKMEIVKCRKGQTNEKNEARKMIGLALGTNWQ